VDGLLSLANRAWNMSASQREPAMQGCRQQVAEHPQDRWAQLRLAILLIQQPGPTSGDLTHAHQLLADYLADPAHKPRNALDFAQLQLSRIETLQRWQRALRNQVRARRDLEDKLEALKAIELRMNQSESARKVPLERQ
jgi:hypothetical protein